MNNQVQICLILAIADILVNASNGGETPVTLVVPQGALTRNSPVQPQQCSKITIKKLSAADTLLLVHALVK